MQKPTRRALLGACAAAPALMLSPTLLRAATPRWFAPGGVAINGYDPVGYFIDEKPLRGSADFRFKWDGAMWHFAFAANRDAFAANPERYAPKYGGYCAYAVSRGYTASTSPRAWRVWEGRLYLNFNRAVRALWERDIPGNVKMADANWPGVLEA